MYEDSLLVEAILAGQKDRFAELVDKYKDKVYNMACHMTGSPHEGQDLAQEIFLLIYKNIGSYKGQSALSTWIYRISLNRCIDWQRKKKRSSRLLIQSFFNDKDDTADPMQNVASNEPDPEQQYLKSEQYTELHKAIGQLPEKYYKVIMLYHFQQMSYTEIAEVLELPVRTIETQLYRGKQKLKEILQEKSGKGVNSYEFV